MDEVTELMVRLSSRVDCDPRGLRIELYCDAWNDFDSEGCIFHAIASGKKWENFSCAAKGRSLLSALKALEIELGPAPEDP